MMGGASQGILDRTLRQLQRALGLTGRGPGRLKTGLHPSLPDSDLDRVRHHIDDCLAGRGGEVSARARAAELGDAYLSLDSTGRKRFLELLACEYDVDAPSIDSVIAARRDAPDDAGRREAETQLREALVAPRVRLLARFSNLNQGVKFLVDLRAELLTLIGQDSSLRRLDADVRGLLSQWFDIGFLELKHVTWSTPASFLEKLIEYEAVHEISSWADLKKRLEQDRRCYAYVHAGMPDEPLIFVEVALVSGLADNIHDLLDTATAALEPERADTAIFYSISNCQRGLAGVSFGNFLIKRVVDDLSHELPNVKTFATLSPLPGFMTWLAEQSKSTDPTLLDADEEARLAELTGATNGIDGLVSLATSDEWTKNENLTLFLEPIMKRLCAQYLVDAGTDSRARDPVAHFHLSNGARIERINWMADLSHRGLKQSAGMMVNYLYRLKDIEKNHESYTGDGQRIAAAEVVRLRRNG